MTQAWTKSENQILATLQDVVAIDSVNPSLPGGQQGESGMAEYLTAFFGALDIPCELHEALPGRHNFIATFEGENTEKVLLFECHMDTASAQVMTMPPFEPHIRDGLLYGRGACDTKGSLVAMVESLRLLEGIPRSERATVVMVGGIDEEAGGTGAQALVEAHPEIEIAVVGEPTGLEVATAHKGVVRFEIATIGMPAHSSKPHLGHNAIHAMSRVLDSLETEYIPALDPDGHHLVGPATRTVTTIEGGAGINVVPAECVIGLDRRVIPGEDHDDLLAGFDELLGRLEGVQVERRNPFMITSALDTPLDAPVVQALLGAREQVTGRRAQPIGVTYGTDASCFDPAGISCVIFGPGSIDQAHSDEEWVGIEETARAAEILAQTAMDLAD